MADLERVAGKLRDPQHQNWGEFMLSKEAAEKVQGGKFIPHFTADYKLIYSSSSPLYAYIREKNGISFLKIDFQGLFQQPLSKA